MGTSPNELTSDGGGGGEPAMVSDASGTFVPQNEEMVYEDPEWEWASADSLLEAGE